MIIIGCSKSRELAKSIAKKLKVKYSELLVNKFPDGEFHIRYMTDIKNETIVLVQTLHEPNESTLELLFAAYTAKDLGAKKIIAVCPYLAYMRQDKRFNSGEGVSSKFMGQLFKIFDTLITIDPHLHRYKNLNEAYPIKCIKLSANLLIEDFIAKNYNNPIIIGPDDESYQWASSIANKIHASAAVMHKNRFTSNKVRVHLNEEIDMNKKDVIIIDDIISTGHTIFEAIKTIKKDKPKSINIIAIHGVFADKKIYDDIKDNTKSIVTTNTIQNKHSDINVADLIANALK